MVPFLYQLQQNGKLLAVPLQQLNIHRRFKDNNVIASINNLKYE